MTAARRIYYWDYGFAWPVTKLMSQWPNPSNQALPQNTMSNHIIIGACRVICGPIRMRAARSGKAINMNRSWLYESIHMNALSQFIITYQLLWRIYIYSGPKQNATRKWRGTCQGVLTWLCFVSLHLQWDLLRTVLALRLTWENYSQLCISECLEERKK